jgi:Cu2+-exporting ATPase
MARALEAQSSHAVARAFQMVGRPALHVVRTVEQVTETPGRGIAGLLDGRQVRVGNRAHVERDAVMVPAAIEAADAMLVEGLSPVFVAVDREVVGVAGIGDALRPDARDTVTRLTERGLRVCILSGDHPDVVARVGAQLGLAARDWHGALTPESKRDLVTILKAEAGPSAAVVMVGDGVNDAAALALADVGIAVHGGMGATIVAADIVFTRDGVRPLLDLFDGARRLRGVVRRNITFSLLYNLSASSLAIAGAVGPLLAALLMPLSSLVVVLSSTLTRTFSRSRRGAR